MLGPERDGPGIAGLGDPAAGPSGLPGLPPMGPGERLARRLPVRRIVRVLVLLALAFAIVRGAVALWPEDGVDMRLPNTGVAGIGGPSSYVEPKAFDAALAEIRELAGPGARTSLLRVDDGQVWGVVDTASGRDLVVRAAGGKVEVNGTEAGATTEAVPLERIDVRAPQRLRARVQQRFGVPRSAVDFMVLVPYPGEGGWNLYLEDGAGSFSSDAHGRAVSDRR